jgi:hypothetical protein
MAAAAPQAIVLRQAAFRKTTAPPRGGVAMNASPVYRWALAVAAGSALVIAWHAAIDGALIVPAPPDPMPSGTPDETFAAYFAWLRGIAMHDLGVRVLAASTFLALAGLGRTLTALRAGAGAEAEPPTMATAGRLLVVAGLFGALGQLVELGGHQAAIFASGSNAPFATVGLLEFFVDQVGAAILTSAWAIFGVAALASALATRGWLALPGTVLGAALLVMAGSRLFDDPADIAGTLLFVTGIGLVPSWALSLLMVGTQDLRVRLRAA